MTRAEAIKALKKELQIIDDPNVTMTASEWEEHDDYMRDALEMAIEALEQKQKWIPVTERLPKTGEMVLITETLWMARGVDVDWWNGEQWVRNGQYVIAWQPLPEPYKESDGE